MCWSAVCSHIQVNTCFRCHTVWLWKVLVFGSTQPCCMDHNNTHVWIREQNKYSMGERCSFKLRAGTSHFGKRLKTQKGHIILRSDSWTPTSFFSLLHDYSPSRWVCLVWPCQLWLQQTPLSSAIWNCYVRNKKRRLQSRKPLWCNHGIYRWGMKARYAEM